jgi:hypothetical protein
MNEVIDTNFSFTEKHPDVIGELVNRYGNIVYIRKNPKGFKGNDALTILREEVIKQGLR